METNTICHDCQKWNDQNSVFVNTAMFEYDEFMKEFMYQYKFNGDYRLRLIFATCIKDFIRSHFKKTNLVVVPIPVSMTTMNTRGFNQVCGLLEYVNYQECLTVKSIDKPLQSHKNRQGRLSTAQPFELINSTTKNLAGKNILIVDDVYTTGTTIRHAVKALEEVHPASILGMTLSR
ncbi:ComF family protein [Lentilactobacillus sp. SPB1-3]|uniref:ComF family protein n=1 Tax=Lentilactobacillus terminaliae TaxID=3003483 RepID=A0ACD5DH49_9LACO|nr:phosphoribosyltransferase family protein [Lentilactobacillus sp. SPB1-3]MCZ0976937.1 phosphoribosyltransferase family protein [Lentilactobacillus sp. SPB1-3]